MSLPLAADPCTVGMAIFVTYVALGRWLWGRTKLTIRNDVINWV